LFGSFTKVATAFVGYADSLDLSSWVKHWCCEVVFILVRHCVLAPDRSVKDVPSGDLGGLDRRGALEQPLEIVSRILAENRSGEVEVWQHEKLVTGNILETCGCEYADLFMACDAD
jgi:hypothetical protein